MGMKFPQDLLRFLYRIFFKPISLHIWIDRLDPRLGNVLTLLTHSYEQPAQPFKNLALFYILIVPWLLGFGTGMALSQHGLDVNWLRLAFYLLIGIMLSVTFDVVFCIAFLLPFSAAVAIWSSISFNLTLGILFSLMLGLAYGLGAGSARWGLTASLVYSVLLGLFLGPLTGLTIGAAFLMGYFRIVFYLWEAPLSWILGMMAPGGDALRLWQYNPVLWDELIWFPLPRLERHLLAIKRQNEPAAQAAILYVRESFRQKWAAERALEEN